VNHEGPAFPEYGYGGDHAGARRVRRAFRLCVAACLCFTTALWLAEYFFRYDTAERLYVNALTHHPESGRVMLRSAVKIDAETRESPTPKYVAALAEREEDDLVLETYEKAYKLDPDNAFLAVRYGCQLFLRGEFKEARERFREAGAHPPKNALPGYLEAAALQWAPPAGDDLAESLSLVARTNSGGEHVTFPRPAWPTAILPLDGAWYVKLRREAIDECCAPLYRYARFVTQRASEDIAKGQIQHWDFWPKTLQEMGERLMSRADPGAVQTIAGIQIQLEALELRNRISEVETGAARGEFIERELELRKAHEELVTFERARDARIGKDREAYVFPWLLCGFSLACLLVFYLPVCALSKLARVGRATWTLPHSKAAKVMLTTAGGTMWGLLCLVAVIQRFGPPDVDWQGWIAYPWAAVLLGSGVFGVAYPSLRLPNVRAVADAAGAGEADDRVLQAARKCRRNAGISLMRRYYGILLGAFLCVTALWCVLYRVFVSLYPWQVALLSTGLAQEEEALVRKIILDLLL